ncbi:MAG: hypothetical protein JNK94_05550 [Hyphomonadaceae bacterium]|nr:hypothetical protein [Hyphomonadaceae bacterium]MBX3510232.1 hypothetical protein [Hyphomonadaceae bacterium]
MHSRQPLITRARVEAYTASALRLLMWLLGIVLRLPVSGRSARLKAELAYAERATEHLLFLHAVARFGPPPQRKIHPRFAARGFRRVRAKRLRLFYRGAGVRARKAAPLTRVLALLHALANPERAIAYFSARLRAGLRAARVLPTAPPAHTFVSAGPAHARTQPDTS